MTSWGDVRAAAPELAATVEATFRVRKHATLATVRADGSPRISGTEVTFDDREVGMGMMAGARKAADLQRDPRLALHCPTVDAAEGEESAWAGDGKIAGLAVAGPPGEDGSHRFTIDVTEVVHTCVGTPADHLVITSWHPDRGLEVVKRA